MKKKQVLMTCMAFLLSFGVTGCNQENDTPVAQRKAFELTNFANTGCKNNTRSVDDEWKQTVSYAVLQAGYLYLNHQNAMFNCCPGTLGADVRMEGNNITIGEYESASDCDCICTYDLSYEIGPLTEGETYTISIGQKGLEPEVAEFTFRNTMSGEWDIPRD